MVKKLINISEKTLNIIKDIATKEKRNVNAQISYMLEKGLENSNIEPKTLTNFSNNKTPKREPLDLPFL